MISIDALSIFHFLGVFGLSLIASGIVLNAFAGLLLQLAKKQSYE